MLGVAAFLFSIHGLVAQQKEEVTIATFNSDMTLLAMRQIPGQIDFLR